VSSMEDIFMRYIRVLCHDILNHLQVISGLSQLQKTERIRTYVHEVSNQIKEIGRLARLGHAGLAAGLFGFLQWLSRFGISYRLQVAAAESLHVLPDQLPVTAFADGLALLGSELASLEGVDKPVLVTVATEEAGYFVRITLPGSEEKMVAAARSCAASINTASPGNRGCAQVLNEDGLVVLAITLAGTADAVRSEVKK